jgi:protein-disulfide isomerase
MRRRRLLGALGTAGAVGLAGCTGGSDGSGGGDGGGDGSGSGDPWELPDHPALTELDAEPALGPDPGEAPGLVVGFEDPACISCRRFEEGTLPKLKSDHVANGDLTFVYRVLPITYAWGRPATQALEATYAAAREGGAGRDAAPFWDLKDHYYAEQDAFNVDNVLDRTETYLASETDLDAAAVIEAAREKRHDDRVQADMDAAEAADAVATPTFFLFRDGKFKTSIMGAQSYDVFATALGF